MRPIRAMLLVAMVAAVAAGPCFAAGPKASKGAYTSKTAPVVWFSGEASEGLEQDRRGDLVASGQRLKVRPRVKDLYAAAYYSSPGVLVTVDGKAVTRLYERKGTRLELTQTRPPREPEPPGYRLPGPIRPIVVRFSATPGLVYLTWSYPEPHTPRATGWQYTERHALGARARGGYAVTTRDPKATFLQYTYRVPSPTSVRLSMPDGRQVVVLLADQLRVVPDPQWPYIEDEPVFVLPGRAIVCRTRDGWSLHGLNGKPIHYFPSGRAGKSGGATPCYRDGHFYVGGGPKAGGYYRMDVEAGKLIYVGMELPEERPQRAH